MKICEGKEHKNPDFISGNLYRNIDEGYIAIYCVSGVMIDIRDGDFWDSPENLKWEDVTDKYCLKRIDDE